MTDTATEVRGSNLSIRYNRTYFYFMPQNKLENIIRGGNITHNNYANIFTTYKNNRHFYETFSMTTYKLENNEKAIFCTVDSFLGKFEIFFYIVNERGRRGIKN